MKMFWRCFGFVLFCASLSVAQAVPSRAPDKYSSPDGLFLSTGEPLTLVAPYQGRGKLAYRWYKNGKAINGATLSKYTPGSAVWAHTGAYTLEVTDAADGAKVSRTFFVNVAMSKGHLLAWGDNEFGQTEVPAALLPPQPIHAIAAGEAHSLAITRGVVHAWGDNSAGQCDVPSWPDARACAVAAGAAHSLVLFTDGTVRAWGDNAAGQSQVPVGLGKVRAVAAGGSHSLALLQDGRVAGWGENSSGQLNAPALPLAVMAIAAGHDHSLALLVSGAVVAWGANDLGQSTVPAGLKNIISVGAAGDVSFAISNTGQVHVWGDTSFGQAPAPVKPKPMAQAAGGWDFIAGRLTSGGLLIWGEGAGRLAAPAAGIGNIQMVAAGGRHLLVLRGDSNDPKPTIKTQPVAPAATEWSQPVELGVTVNGASPLLRYQWYFNGWPIKGANEAVHRIAGMRSDLAGSYYVRVYNGTKYVDSAVAKVVPPPLPSFVSSRIGATRLVARAGERLRLEVEATGAGVIRAEWWRNGVKLAAENALVLEKTVAGASDAGVYEAVLRDESNRAQVWPFFVVVPPAQPTQVVAWGDNSRGQTETPAGLHDIVELAAGQSHTVALRADGTVVAWGDDEFGQCTVPEDLDEVVAITAGAAYSAALRADGTLVAWGGGRAPVWKTTGNPRISMIRLTPAGVFGIERFERSYTLGFLPGGSDTVAYSVLADGNAAGGALYWYFAPILPLPAPVAAGVAGAKSASAVVSSNWSFSGTIIIGGDSGTPHPGWPYERSFVYPDYARGVVAVDHRDGRVAVLDAAGRVRLWHTGWYWDEDYWGYRERYVASSPINDGGTIEGVSDVAVGTGFYVWRRTDGGVGGFSSEPAAFLRAPYRLDGVKSLRAGSRHVVAVLEAQAPEAPRVVEMSEGRAAAPGETVRLRVRAEGRHLRYQWLRDGEAIEGAEDASLDIVGFDAARAGAYRVRLSDGFTSVLSDACELSVGVAPVLAQAPAARLGLREGDRFELRAEVENADAGLGYEWRRDGVVLLGESAPVLVRESVALADAGRYTLTVRAADGAATRTTSHVFVLPVAGTSIVHENAELYPRSPAGKWSELDDAVDFLGEGLALRLDGRVAAWDNGYFRDEATLAWVDQLRDVVAIAGWGVLRSDGRVEVSPLNAGMLQNAADELRDVVAMLSHPTAVVTADGRLGVFESRIEGRVMQPAVIRWFPSVGDFVSARSVAVGTTPEKSTSGGVRSEPGAVVIGADGSVVTTHSGGLLGFAGQSSARRVLSDLEGGISIVDAEGEVRASAVFGRLRAGDPALSEVIDTEERQQARAELLEGGRVRAWATDLTTGVKTERESLAVWRRDNLRVRLDGSRVMVLRSRNRLPTVTFASTRVVFAADQPVVLEPEIGGGLEGVYQWERNGGIVRGATSSRLELPAGDPRNRGWYRLRFTDTDGNFAEAITYLLVGSVNTPSPGFPAPDGLIYTGHGIGISADGSVKIWDPLTGQNRGMVPEVVRNVVAVLSPNIALDASGRLTQWNTVTGEIIRQTEGVLWIRDGDRRPGFAIMRDGTVRSLEDGSLLFGNQPWHREIIDIREGQVGRNDLRAITRRDGSVAIAPKYTSSGATVSFLSPEELGGTVVASRVTFFKGAEFLVETSDGEFQVVNAQGAKQPANVEDFLAFR